MAITHPTFGTSSIVGTWTRGNTSGTAYKITGFALGTGSGASGSNEQPNTKEIPNKYFFDISGIPLVFLWFFFCF